MGSETVKHLAGKESLSPKDINVTELESRKMHLREAFVRASSARP